MLLRLTCPACGRVEQLSDRVLGKEVRCPCGTQFRVLRPRTAGPDPGLGRGRAPRAGPGIPAGSSPPGRAIPPRSWALEPSVALIKGKVGSGTGFVVKRGIVATNSHVIEEELIDGIEVRFPGAPRQAGSAFAQLFTRIASETSRSSPWELDLRRSSSSRTTASEKARTSRSSAIPAWETRSCSRTRSPAA